MNMKNIFLAAWLAMNGFTFCLYGVDKRRAKRGAWRIPEKTLLLCTWLLGGVGALIGMRVFRHKTKHRAFTVSAPIAAAISIAATLARSSMVFPAILPFASDCDSASITIGSPTRTF